MTLCLGIDPGKTGAMVAIVKHDGTKPSVFRVWETAREFVTPGKKPEYRPDSMFLEIKRYPGVEMAVLESPLAPFPKRGEQFGTGGRFAAQKLGIGFGLWWMALAAAGVPYIIRAPAVWMRAMLTGEPGEGKTRAIGVATRLLPGIELPRAKRRAEAVAEAACMALYGLRQLAPHRRTDGGHGAALHRMSGER